MSEQLPEDGQQTVPTCQGTPPPQVDFPPVHNGIDYLTSVVEHLSHTRPDPRDLKYAVLHLHAATEVLLKARLQIEHWSLVFLEPLTATREKLGSGAFTSCGVEETIDRLERFASIRIEHKHHQAIKALTLDRNKLQHYGLTHNAYAVEARAAVVLHFLMDFIHLQLLWRLDQEQRDHAERELGPIRSDLPLIERFVDARMNNIKDVLASCPEYTLQCADCGKWAALVMDVGGVRCLFCNTERDHPLEAAIWYLAQAGNQFITGSSTVPTACPTCGEETFRGDVLFADAPDRPRYFCFCCHFTTETALCTRCARPFPADGNRSECGTCTPPSPAVPTPRNVP
ncbi:hypothetical protein [Streptomyces sp. AgN23]|uniref:hypothetical protein n=1 Tax=Streptomyces sp. AgN23 TaxID=1188315 RepID=UPI001B33635C|nr:hypothetical protein [Streptomyces sp. AgN23]QTI87214.1 hypothetical protein AS97_39625 [Streptomyces sp. AgN23]WTB02800.1 hypothetical protein OG546_00050 [Streptomyces antimycoticus]WTB11320.1 hypothetical protein OG546_49070 [Streptomyces antimycoticus]